MPAMQGPVQPLHVNARQCGLPAQPVSFAPSTYFSGSKLLRHPSLLLPLKLLPLKLLPLKLLPLKLLPPSQSTSLVVVYCTCGHMRHMGHMGHMRHMHPPLRGVGPMALMLGHEWHHIYTYIHMHTCFHCRPSICHRPVAHQTMIQMSTC
jgi:hypothetical protein